MNIIDQVYAVLIYVWSELNKPAMTAGLVAVVVAVLRMRKLGHVVWSEALLCGVFATIAILGARFVLHLLGVPTDGWLSMLADGGSTIVGGAIGWYGTDKTVDYIEDKVGANKDEADR